MPQSEDILSATAAADNSLPMPSPAPLLKNELELYDIQCLLNVGPQVAQGFIVMLGGMTMDVTSQKKQKLKESDLNLAFMAVTDGNVVDACFGVSNTQRNDSAGKVQCKKVKAALADVGSESDVVKRAIVDTYRKAFREIVEFHEKVGKLSMWTFCFRYGKLARNAEGAIYDLFENLVEVISSST